MQVKDKFVIGTDGYKYYFEPGSGNLAILRYVQNSKNQWFYFDGNGHAVTGFQTINGKNNISIMMVIKVKVNSLMQTVILSIRVPLMVA